MGRWDDRLIDQASDVPNIIFKLAVRLRTSGASKNPDSCRFFPNSKFNHIYFLFLIYDVDAQKYILQKSVHFKIEIQMSQYNIS